MRKILASLCVGLLCVLLCGCSSVSYTLAQHPDGSITETVRVVPDQAELDRLGLDRFTLLNHVRNQFAEYLTANSVKMSQFGVTLTVVPEIVGASDTELTATLKFNNALKYSGYYSIPNVASEYDYERDLFLTKQILYHGTSDFGGSFVAGFVEAYTEFVAEHTSELIDTSKVKFIYTQGTLDSRTRSDADGVYQRDGVYYHVWNIGLGEIDREITLYRVGTTGQNRAMWYVAAVVATALIMLIPTTMHFIKRTKNKA